MDIDKKIAEIEKWANEYPMFQGAFNIETLGINNALGWLIKELKACREWRKTQEQGVHEVIEQHTKEAVWGEIDQLPVEMGLLSKEAVKQAIDSAGKP